jgi:hypothetical protein
MKKCPDKSECQKSCGIFRIELQGSPESVCRELIPQVDAFCIETHSTLALGNSISEIRTLKWLGRTNS